MLFQRAVGVGGNVVAVGGIVGGGVVSDGGGINGVVGGDAVLYLLQWPGI